MHIFRFLIVICFLILFNNSYSQNRLSYKKNTITDTIKTNIFNIPTDSTQFLYHKDLFFIPEKSHIRVDLYEIPYISKARFISKEPMLFNKRNKKERITAILIFSFPHIGFNCQSISIKKNFWGQPIAVIKGLYTTRYNHASEFYGYILEEKKIKMPKNEYEKIHKYIKNNNLYDVAGVETEYHSVDGYTTTIEISNKNRYNVLHQHGGYSPEELVIFFEMIENVGREFYFETMRKYQPDEL